MMMHLQLLGIAGPGRHSIRLYMHSYTVCVLPASCLLLQSLFLCQLP